MSINQNFQTMSQRKRNILCPKTAKSAFEVLDEKGKSFGVVFEYEGITETANSNTMFYATFQPVRKEESRQPITFLGKHYGYTFCWKDIDIATRVYIDENAFLDELQLVGRAFFLESSVSKVCSLAKK